MTWFHNLNKLAQIQDQSCFSSQMFFIDPHKRLIFEQNITFMMESDELRWEDLDLDQKNTF